MSLQKPKPHRYISNSGTEDRKPKPEATPKKRKKRRKPKPPRKTNWLQHLHEFEDLDYELSERIMPPGEAERRRKTIETSTDLTKVASEADKQERVEGLVLEVSGAICQVKMGDEMLSCSLRGRLKEQETGYSNLVAVGDKVMIVPANNRNGVIEEILPRRGTLVRPSSSNSHLQQIIAANVDQLLIVAAWRQPQFWPELVDRYLVTALRNHLQAIICVNKVDLVQNQNQLQATLQTYLDMQQPLILTSAIEGTGVDELRERLEGQTTVLVGLSGVGKTSLLNVIQPGMELSTKRIGTRGKNTNQGRHSTTSAVYIPLHIGGAVVDTPGIREFGLAGLHKSELGGYFREFIRPSSKCKYADCIHFEEPNCGVLQGIKDGKISTSRYDSYIKIRATLPD